MILCLVTGKFYIGSSKDLYGRRDGHMSGLRNQKHGNHYLQNAWNKYKEDDFVFIAIEWCAEDLLITKEQEYLDLYAPYNRDIGYNICPKAYSKRGVKASEETKKRQSVARKGKKMPDTVRKAFAEYRRIHGAANARDFSIVSPSGELFMGKNITRFEKQHGINKGLLGDVVRGKSKTAIGWHLLDYKAREPYRILNPKGELVEIEYGKLESFAKNNHLSAQNLRRVMRKARTHHRGWSHTDNSHHYVTLVNENHIEKVNRYYLIEFEKSNNLGRSNLCSLIKGKLKSFKGWTLESYSEGYNKANKVETPTGDILYIPKGKIRQVAIKLNLDAKKFYRVVTGNRKEYAGYKTLESLTWISKPTLSTC